MDEGCGKKFHLFDGVGSVADSTLKNLNYSSCLLFKKLIKPLGKEFTKNEKGEIENLEELVDLLKMMHLLNPPGFKRCWCGKWTN